MKDLNPSKEAAYYHLVDHLDRNKLLLWFSNMFKEAESETKAGYMIWHDGHLTIKVDTPQNMTFLEGSKFKLVAERQEKFYTYFFTFEDSDV